MMKSKFLIIGLCMSALSVYAQNDTITRVVEVEREFQPVIEGAGKLDIAPQVLEAPISKTEISFSEYAEPMRDVDPTEQVNLGYAPTNFIMPRPLNGFLRGGIGHSATLFDFNYNLTEKRGLSLDLNAHHLGQWGRKTLSHSSLGMDINRIFDKTQLFFGVDAENIFFTRYGKYFTYTDLGKMRGDFSTLNLNHYSDFAKADKSSQWEIDTRIGVRSLPGADVKYLVKTGYEAFVMKQNTVEHTINSELMFEWQKDVHHVGADLHIENHLYTFNRDSLVKFINDPLHDNTIHSADSTDYHAIKLEPYYAYNGKRFMIHVGVNLDMCVGKGKLFLPSPNVSFEAKLTPTWLALYGGAKGEYATSSVREHFGILRYLYAENEISTRANRTYTPVDAFLGFKIRPHANFLMDIYADYKYTKYDVFFRPSTDADNKFTGYFDLVSEPYQRWQIGARFHYHYQDIVFISLDGFYNIWKGDKNFNNLYQIPDNHILDRPTWGVNLRVDGKIDSKWSVYTVNWFSGGAYALDTSTFATAVALKPVIDLNVGAQYNVNKWLSCYLQLNNLLNRKHDVFYGYQSQGINFLLGVSYAF
ncbi:MAG: TonB-dependent receptor [Paludibacteraceae bacterium]|nr:TonB-dependent receptor [Paludibacteraceae bacterium]